MSGVPEVPVATVRFTTVQLAGAQMLLEPVNPAACPVIVASRKSPAAVFAGRAENVIEDVVEVVVVRSEDVPPGPPPIVCMVVALLVGADPFAAVPTTTPGEVVGASWEAPWVIPALTVDAEFAAVADPPAIAGELLFAVVMSPALPPVIEEIGPPVLIG